jgi:hypothetical protein
MPITFHAFEDADPAFREKPLCRQPGATIGFHLKRLDTAAGEITCEECLRRMRERRLQQFTGRGMIAPSAH